MQVSNCPNCQYEVTHKYCPNCGQSAQLKRIDGHYMLHEIEHIFHVERGFLYTVKSLLLNPGDSVKQFLFENRNRLTKPVVFIIITSLIYTFCLQTAGVMGHSEKAPIHQPTTDYLLDWMQHHYGYSNLIWGVLIAGWSSLFFKKYKYTFFELLIMLCFVQGISMLILSLFVLLQPLTSYMPTVQGMTVLAYTTWAIGHFFDKRKWSSYVIAFLAYVLGLLTYFILMFIIGDVVDKFIKH